MDAPEKNEQEKNLRRLWGLTMIAGFLLLGGVCFWLYEGVGYWFDEMSYASSLGPRRGPRLALPAGSVPWQPAPDPPAAPRPGEGAALYANNCVFCHAADGSGDTPIGQEYWPRPPLLSAWLRAHDAQAVADAVRDGIPTPEVDTSPPLTRQWHAFSVYLTPAQLDAVDAWVEQRFGPAPPRPANAPRRSLASDEQSAANRGTGGGHGLSHP